MAVVLAAWFHDGVYDGAAGGREAVGRLGLRGAADPGRPRRRRRGRPARAADRAPPARGRRRQRLRALRRRPGDPGRAGGAVRGVRRRRPRGVRPRAGRRLRRRPRHDPARPAGQAPPLPHAYARGAWEDAARANVEAELAADWVPPYVSASARRARPTQGLPPFRRRSPEAISRATSSRTTSVRRRRRPPRRSTGPARRSGRGRSRAAGCRGPRRTRAARRRTHRWPGATTAGRAPTALGGSMRIIRRCARPGRPRRRAAAARSGRGRRRRRPCTTRPGGLHPEVELPDAGSHEPRDVLGEQPAAGHQQLRDPRVGGGREQLVVPGLETAGRTRGPHADQAGQVEQPAPGSARVERVVDRAAERPRDARERGREVGADLGVHLEVGVEEAERDAAGAAGQVVLGEPDQPGQLPPVVRPACR